jgi:Transposase DDE domain/Transposase domain (DUF772)
MKRWNPSDTLSRKEEFLMKRLRRTRKLFAFLRLHRRELFDDAFQDELEAMYRRTGAGNEPVPPALMCMATLLQGYLRVSDAEAVELSIVDARWQMVLGCLGSESPAFSQGALQGFRERLIRSDMDRRLLEKTIELARKTEAFDWKKLPKDLRLAVDSRPLVGAGKVEDTFNLLGHAARKIVECTAKALDIPIAEICRRAGTPIFLHASVKAALDVNWSDPEEKERALERLVDQVTSLHDWIKNKDLPVDDIVRPYIDAVAQVRKQDLEEDGQGKVRIRQGVAEDRRVSIEDKEMRHGRKSKSKRFNGYKQHIAADMDTGLISACAITPANRPEEEAMPALQIDIGQQTRNVAELSIDRAYINSTMVADVLAAGGEVVAKPWAARNVRKGMFTKSAFKIDMRSRTITCPAGQVEGFEPGDVVEFDPEQCGSCQLRSQCTFSASGRGRTVQIAEDEQLQHRLRKLQSSPSGRERLRERVCIEHHLAHIAARQGPRARYNGCRKNLFDLRRASAIQNLETNQRKMALS